MFKSVNLCTGPVHNSYYNILKNFQGNSVVSVLFTIIRANHYRPNFCKSELLKNYGFRCQNSVIYMTTLRRDTELLHAKTSTKKKTKYVSTDVINVTDATATSQKTNVTLIKPSNFEGKSNLFLSNISGNLFSEKELEIADPLATTSSPMFCTDIEASVNDTQIEDSSHITEKDTVDNWLNNAEELSVNEAKTRPNKINKSNAADSKKRRSLPPWMRKKKKKMKRELYSKAIPKLVDLMKQKSKSHSFNRTLGAYLSVCSNGDEKVQEMGLKMFLSFAESKNIRYQITYIEVYNQALRCLQNMTQYDVEVVTDHLCKSDVQPDATTFAQIFSCLGKRPACQKNLNAISKNLQCMKELHMSLDMMFGIALFHKDTVKYCVEALQRILPADSDELHQARFSIKNVQSMNEYQNKLVNQLNSSFFTTQAESPLSGIISLEELKKGMEEQFAVELKGYAKIPSVYKAKDEQETIGNAQLLNEWEEEWRQNLRRIIDRQIKFKAENFFRGSKKYQWDLYPYLAAVPAEDLVNLLIQEIHKLGVGLLEAKIGVEQLYISLGYQVYKRYVINCKCKSGFLNELQKAYQLYMEWYLNRPPGSSYIPRIQWENIICQTGSNGLKDCIPEWPFTARRSVGEFLYNIMIAAVKVYNPTSKNRTYIPAFTIVLHNLSPVKHVNTLEASQFLIDVFNMVMKTDLSIFCEGLPMVVPPIPWYSPRMGGNLMSQPEFIRHVPHAYLQKKRIAEVGNRQIFPLFDSLNQLGSVPWKINTDLLDIMIQFFSDAGWDEMDIQATKPAMEEPPEIDGSMTKDEKRSIRCMKREYRKAYNENYSLWCNTLYKLSLANHYRDRVFWLPHNMDFRGRTYTISPHLSHHSADIFRSLLLFAQGKELGKDGLRWLKIHIINLTDMKKRCSIQERLDFTEEMIEDIIDSAENPVNGRRWWTKSAEPWQTLAACRELAAALKSENPEEFVSHLPLHQDGSCNGLQHYAALGRDMQGSKSVNLSPAVVPQDIYSDVLAIVEEKRKCDAENGLDIAQALEGFIVRKVIKQTVMTTVYGVTMYGAKLQIAKQLNAYGFQPRFLFYGAHYLAKRTFESLGELFHPTQKIQDWLVQCADGLSHVCLQNVEWVMPLGLPIVQPYINVWYLKAASNSTPGQIPFHYYDDSYALPDRMKQKNAFPPNYIHSLDSSHMMLTSLYCQQKGITFVSVHDCFWTHACSVPIMNEICREQFINLHSQPLLEDLSKFLVDKLDEHRKLVSSVNLVNEKTKAEEDVKVNSEDIVRDAVSRLQNILLHIPKKGTFDLQEVKNSTFFFS